MPNKYVGSTVEIIYMDRTGALSQRHIYVQRIKDGVVHAKCLLSGAPRTFRVENILAWQKTDRSKSDIFTRSW